MNVAVVYLPAVPITLPAQSTADDGGMFSGDNGSACWMSNVQSSESGDAWLKYANMTTVFSCCCCNYNARGTELNVHFIPNVLFITNKLKPERT